MNFDGQDQEQDVALSHDQGSLLGVTGSVMHRRTTEVPSSTPVNTEQGAPDHLVIDVADMQTVNTRECLECPANPYLKHTCPLTFRDYKSMRIHIKQDHTYLVSQPAVCICSLTKVSTSDACRKSGCAWFFDDNISDDTTIAGWDPGMDKSTEDTRPNPLPFPCQDMPYLDPEHQCPARFANVDDMRAHAIQFHKILPPHDPVCACALEQHARFLPCRAIGCAWFFTLLVLKRITHIDWRPGHTTSQPSTTANHTSPGGYLSSGTSSTYVVPAVTHRSGGRRRPTVAFLHI
jgi:hypothetical protein